MRSFLGGALVCVGLVACGDDGGGSRTEVVVTAGTPASATIGASGGTVALADGSFALDVPAGALSADTTIALTPLLVGTELFGVRLEPSGTTFAVPAMAAVPLDRGYAFMPILVADDGTAVGIADGTIDNVANHPTAHAPIPHFSTVFGFPKWQSLNMVAELIQVTRQSPPQLGPYALQVPFPTFVSADTQVSEQIVDLVVDPGEVPIKATVSHPSARIRGVRDPNAPSLIVLPDEGSELKPLTAGQSTLLGMTWECEMDGAEGALVGPQAIFQLDVDMDVFIREDNHHLTIEQRRMHSYLFTSNFYQNFNHDVTCNTLLSVIAGVPLSDPQRADLKPKYKIPWGGACTPLSDNSKCEVATTTTRVEVVVDPVLTLGASAVTTMGTQFPCGDGPIGKTLCAPGATFTAGDWVYVEATVADPINLADTVGRYQYAFVFDADGVTTNNYQAGAQYPKDFFQGTDKWYEALYTPQAGWSISVRDVRLGSGQQPSNARFVLAGRELALFIPRSELNGASPGFRVTAFRHEGDFGLSGGPWSGSYFPELGKPLYPAASGAPFVLP